jgi:hypothetical protein
VARYTVTLLGYTNPHHTNWYPWKMFQRVICDLGYACEWMHPSQLDRGADRPRIFVCWNEPDCAALLESGLFRAGDVLLQKLTSLGKGCEHVSWGRDPLTFFQSWTWPLYRMVEQLYDAGINIYAFGCRTNTELFPEKHRIAMKLRDRIFWIPWGSSLFTWEEIQSARPIMDGFRYDIGFVGSKWGVPGRGNADVWEEYVAPLLDDHHVALAGMGNPLGPVDDETHKAILRQSRLCPIVNAPSWSAERGVQDRFWSVFTAGRFGVTDSLGVYDFFDEDEVVCETDAAEYITKSLYYLEHVDLQLPYIEKVQRKIREKYNYYATWSAMLQTILGEN